MVLRAPCCGSEDELLLLIYLSVFFCGRGGDSWPELGGAAGLSCKLVRGEEVQVVAEEEVAKKDAELKLLARLLSVPSAITAALFFALSIDPSYSLLLFTFSTAVYELVLEAAARAGTACFIRDFFLAPVDVSKMRDRAEVARANPGVLLEFQQHRNLMLINSIPVEL